MNEVLYSFAGFLDHQRGKVYRLTLSNLTLRRILTHRSSRLLFLFLLTATVNLILCFFFPLWMLMLGPVIYGVPHLFSSFRYFHYSVASRNQLHDQQTRTRVFRVFAFLFSVVATLRVLVDTGALKIETFSSEGANLESAALILTFGACAWIYKKSSRRILLGFALAAPILYAAWKSPLWTTGALLLVHNAVAFGYWILAAKSSAERKTAALATGMFLLLNFLIFSCALDGLYKFYTPTGEILWAGLSYEQLGSTIAPWSQNYILWFHCVVAYAFGQSLHYFVWLKAIPDQHHTNEIPASFRQSYRSLIEDFGKKWVYGILAMTTAMIAVWIFVSHPQARVIYFAVAAYHGYLELAGLSLARFRVPA